jgi:hypothetical protein
MAGDATDLVNDDTREDQVERAANAKGEGHIP